MSTVIRVPSQLLRTFFEEKWRIPDKKARSAYYRVNPGAKVFIRELQKRTPPVYVLDLGCGDGRFTLRYTRQGFIVQGIDFASTAIERLYQRAKLLHLNTLSGHVCDLRKWRAGRKQYDGISCANTLHYFQNGELRKIVSQIQQATVKGGLNYIAFEAKIDMRLASGLEFAFEKQMPRSERVVWDMLEILYKGWDVLYTTTTPNVINATLPFSLQKYLRTRANHYKRTFSLLDFVAQKSF